MESIEYNNSKKMLHKYRLTEIRYRPQLFQTDEIITTGSRDGAAHMLRFTTIFYDLPSEVFIYAMNLVDLLLSRFHLEPSNLPCVMVACFFIATEDVVNKKYNIRNLVKMMKAHCTRGEVHRMMKVIFVKIFYSKDVKMISTCDWLMQLTGLLDENVREQLSETKMLTHLGMVTCNARLISFRPYEITGNIIVYNMKRAGIAQEVIDRFEHEAVFICAGNLRVFHLIGKPVKNALDQYEGYCKLDAMDVISWRSSASKKRKRSCDLIDPMPTIQEMSPNPKSPRPRTNDDDHDTKGWPRSPVCPVYRLK